MAGGEAATNGEPVLKPAEWPDRYGDTLFRYAVSRLRDREAAEEVVQETFVSALKARDQFSGEGVEGAWLMGILRRKVIDHVRRKKRAFNEPADDGEDLSSRLYDQSGKWRSDAEIKAIPSRSLENADFYRHLHRCIDSLPPRQAMAFVLRELEEFSTEEICQILDTEPSNLSVLLYRARAKLSECLSSYVSAEEVSGQRG